MSSSAPGRTLAKWFSFLEPQARCATLGCRYEPLVPQPEPTSPSPPFGGYIAGRRDSRELNQIQVPTLEGEANVQPGRNRRKSRPHL